ncbi:MAG: response regulator [Actinomycetota bacterium]|nr:response regulator [Actinomycetota bacterium]
MADAYHDVVPDDVKVLLVDDDPVILKLLQVNFEMEGYTVMMANDGIEGVEMARSHRPDIVLCDIMMPRMDGLEVTRTLKADDETRSIPIILLSARAQAFDIQEGKSMGADEYVTKPFDPLELLDRVKDLLEGKSPGF